MRRNSIRFVVWAFVLAALAVGCARSSSPADAVSVQKSKKMTSLDRLTLVMAGSYSSGAQAAEDTAYYDIRLEMVRIWPDRMDGNWLYVEQAVSTYLDKPYRQRVYHLTEEPDGRFRSVVYTLTEPTRFIGAWKDPAQFDAINLKNLELREGCDILLSWNADTDEYSGRTEDKTCESNLRGARWATSEVVLTPSGMVSWDKGLDDDGNQIWGAEKGGYVFDKLAKAPK
jgi:hypothetical protein